MASTSADRPHPGRPPDHRHLVRATSSSSGDEESPGIAGLGIVQARVTRFPETVRVPQFGWNKVEAGEACDLLESGYAYFANSYRALEAPGWRVATAGHGGRFIASMERGKVIGCQFHPELSGDYGAALLSRFLELGQC
jgi:imidazoleglycerol phosphate synthase glutamine amidotransferase subunit HisH